MRSRISTNWPERILSTNLAGKGSVAGDRLNPGDDNGMMGASDVNGNVGLVRWGEAAAVAGPDTAPIIPEGATGWGSDQDSVVA